MKGRFYIAVLRLEKQKEKKLFMRWRQFGGALKSERKAYKGWVFGAETTRWLWIF